MPSSSSRAPPAIILVGGTSSGVGKTTLTCGLLTALTLRGLRVQAFKCGPDFLDGLQHEAALEAGGGVLPPPKTLNLDGWMMGGKRAVLECFLRHCQEKVDVCVIEGVMGLYDSKDGTSDEGSSAQIAKCLNASVVLVLDAGKMARSVAPMALGYAVYDSHVHVDAVVANKVGGPNHVQWIREALEELTSRQNNGVQMQFVGGMPKDQSVAIPERHLGLHMPTDEDPTQGKERFHRLALQIEEHLDLNAILKLGRRRGRELFDTISKADVAPSPSIHPIPPCCRIGVAQDEAFCFYYADNLSLLETFGAELVPFSPLHDDRLPAFLDGIYLGGGYPELYAEVLQDNSGMRNDIHSFCHAGGLIYGECGGMMYLAASLHVSKDHPPYQMCGVFSNVNVRMTPHMKMHYANLEFTNTSLFAPGTTGRGQKFHFSEVVEEQVTTGPIRATPETIRHVEAVQTGFQCRNAVASYYHWHFASNPDIARQWIQKSIETSPRRRHVAVSFASAATEMVFALNAQAKLGGVTSLCDYPLEARSAPRQVVCRSSIDASTLTSEQVEAAMKELQQRAKNDDNNNNA